ncbi:hypothetical protein B0X63_04115 [Helicobacter pylori]|nr:hypothetical protein B0X63_04115 [Helicobacter pylori]
MTKKKKTLYAIILQIHSNANAFQCMKSLILKSNLKRRKHEKNPFTLSLSLSLSRFCSTLKTTAFTQA